jgi:hypothetical protein
MTSPPIRMMTSPLSLEVREMNSEKIKPDIPFLQESDLITFDEDKKLLKLWLNMEYAETTLIYKGTRDGFKASIFHQKCDGKGPTISIVQSDSDQIFGAYT